jgi:WD40 repeat protein
MKSQYLFALATVAVWSFTSFAQERSQDLFQPTKRFLSIFSLAFSTDGRLLAGCCEGPANSGEVVVWDSKTSEVRWSYRFKRGLPSVVFSPDGKTLAVGSFTENCLLFDAGTGKVHSTLSGHGASARSLAFSPDDKTLAVGSYDRRIRLWDWRAGKVMRTLVGQEDKVYRVAYSPDGQVLVSGGANGSVCLWDAASGKLLKKLESGDRAPAIDPRGKWQATAGNDASVTIRSIEDKDRVLAHYEGIFAYRLLVIHPSVKAFAANSGWETGLRIFPLDLREATPADEQRVRKLVALWDEESYAVRETASQDLVKMGNVTKALLAQAAKESASAEVRIRAREVLKSLESPRPLAKLHGHEENPTCVAFSPDGQFLASGSRDGLVLLWDTAAYKQKAALRWPEK